MHVRHQPKGVSKLLQELAHKEIGIRKASLINQCPNSLLLRLQGKEEEEENETEKEHRRVREH